MIEWCILGAFALLIGPYLGLMISQVMGASSGFLSFVSRDILPAQLYKDPYVLTLAALGLTVAALIVPVYSASKQSIVNYKQEVSRRHKAPLWKIIPVDFILIAFAIWGFKQLQAQTQAGAGSEAIILNQSLFLYPAVLILGVGLLTLRLFPWLIKLVDMATSKWAGVSWNMTLKQLYRSPEQYNPLILLIVLTLALGIYSSSTARTMDKNFVDRMSYEYGSDVTLRESWTRPQTIVTTQQMDEVTQSFSSEPNIYEPPFYIHQQLEGVDAAARVQLMNVNVDGSSTLRRLQVMAVNPHEFANTAWYRDGLLPYHINSYLNLLIQRPRGIIIDETAAERSNLKPGDEIALRFDGLDEPIQFTIIGVIKYWPTLYPEDESFGIIDIDYARGFLPLEPYRVWLRMNPDASVSNIVDTLRSEGIWVESIQDLQTDLVKGIREPQRMGLYGMLSTGFLVAAFITIMGFLLYTFLSLKSRMLQFGVLRAIGLKVRQLMGMLVYEQIFTVGLGVAVGTILGEQVSNLFLPMLKLSTDTQRDVPPFLVVVEWSDKLKIYMVLGVALLIGMIGLQIFISTMKIHQAVKLGEDQ